MLGHCAPRSLYHLPSNVISAAIGLVLFVYINLQPEYKFSSFTRFEQFQKFAKNEQGHCLPQLSLRKQFLHGVWVLIHTCSLDFPFLCSINFEDINSFHKLGVQYPYYGSPWRAQSGTIGFYGYDFLLVSDCTRGRILHRFRDIAFHMSLYLAIYPCCVQSPTVGFPWGDLRKILHGGQGMARIRIRYHRNIAERFNRMSIGCTNVTDKLQTELRFATANTRT